MALKVVPRDAIQKNHDTAQLELGSYFTDDQAEKIFVYLKARQDIKQGQAVGPTGSYFNIVADGIEPAAAGSKIIEAKGTTNWLGTGENLAGMANLAETKYKEYPMIFVDGGTGEGQLGVVKTVTSDVLGIEWLTTDDPEGGLRTALDSTSVLIIYVPWLADLPDGAGDNTSHESVVGFAQRDIDEGQYFSALCMGQGLGYRKADAEAIAHLEPLQVSENAGELEPHVGTTEQPPVAYSAVPIPATNDTLTIIPIYAAANIRIGKVPLKYRWG